MAEGIVKIRVQLPAPPPARRPEPYGSESRAYSSERGVIWMITFASSGQVSGVRHKKVSGVRCQETILGNS
jgi:hypothetical protein